MKTRALVLCGDQWHLAETVRRGLGALKNLAIEFEFLEDGSRWSPSPMNEFPLVVVAKANHLDAANSNPWLTPETQSVFRKFVRDGGGLLLLHAGTCYHDLTAMRGVAGGAFLRHPDQCAVRIEPKPGHPLTTGVNSFTEKDEHYFMVVEAEDADIFLHTRSTHGAQPAGWRRTEGAGRVCVLTPGHNLEVWLNEKYQQLLTNALTWTARLN